MTEKTSRFQFKISNKRLFAVGVVLVALGVLMPTMFDIKTFGIYRDLYRAVHQNEQLLVIIAAIKLLVLNVLRGFPHYLGAFYMADAATFIQGGKEKQFYRIAMIFPVIVIVYQMIGGMYGIRYDFGVPAILMIGLLLVLMIIDFNLVSPIKKALMVFFLLCSIQCLDIIPSLSGYPFGRGETTHDVKMVSSYLNADSTLQLTGIAICIMMLIIAILFIILIQNENRIKLVSRQKEQNERAFMDARLKVLEARTYLELDLLVHDLKTPLTSIQALLGVIKLGNTDSKLIGYTSQAEASVERMNDMISEFLDENRLSVLSVKELFRDLLSQVSNTAYAKLVHCAPIQENLTMEANRVRFARMLINLLENAYSAIHREEGRIDILVERDAVDGVPMVRIEIADNGNGIPSDMIDAIWDKGYSTSGSYGLGLIFVKNVVERHKGTISVTSVVGEGTKFTLYFPEVACREQ